MKKKFPIKMVSFGGKIGTRPAVILNNRYGRADVLKITSRMKDEDSPFYAHMNHYIICGFCNTSEVYTVPIDKIGDFKRNCTTSEEDKIMENLAYCKSKELLRTRVI